MKGEQMVSGETFAALMTSMLLSANATFCMHLWMEGRQELEHFAFHTLQHKLYNLGL
jgi:hypothetical protein